MHSNRRSEGRGGGAPTSSMKKSQLTFLNDDTTTGSDVRFASVLLHLVLAFAALNSPFFTVVGVAESVGLILSISLRLIDVCLSCNFPFSCCCCSRKSLGHRWVFQPLPLDEEPPSSYVSEFQDHCDSYDRREAFPSCLPLSYMLCTISRICCAFRPLPYCCHLIQLFMSVSS